MIPATRWPLCLALGCVLTACSAQPDPQREVTSALDFVTGSVQGTVSWHGTPPPNVTSMSVIAATADEVLSWGTTPDASGAFIVTNQPVGTYSARVQIGGCALAPQSVTVAAGVTTTVTFDLDAYVGSLTGILALNGVPAPGRSVSLGPCGVQATTDDAGRFTYGPLPVGPGTASTWETAAGIFGPFGNDLGSLNYTIAAGPVTDVGVWNLGLGAVSGTASWNGEPLSSWPATVRLRPPGFNWTWEAFLDGGAFSVANLVPGTYDAWVSLDCAGSVAIQTLTIAAGANSPAIFDISAEAGRAVGQITSAGAPVASGYVVLSGCGSALGTDPAGNFATSLLAVGSYTAVVYTLTETGYRFLGSLPFAITAGTTTDLGTVDLSPSFPHIEGNVTWNGAPVSSPDAYFVTGFKGNEMWWRAALDGQGHYATTEPPPPPDVYTAVVLSGCESPLGSKEVRLLPGLSARADIDVTETAGRVVGTIAVNGTPLQGAAIIPNYQCTANAQTVADGRFVALLPVGSYDAVVTNVSGTVVGKLPFTVQAGKTTDVGVFNARPGAIIGTVTWNGAPVEPFFDGDGATVEIESASGFLDGAVVEADGRYAISPIMPDTYTLFVSVLGGCSITLPFSVNVPPGESVVLNIALESWFGKVKGTLTADGIASPETEIFFESKDLACGVDTNTNEDATFASYLLAGAYTVWTQYGVTSFAVNAGRTTDLDGVATPTGTGVRIDVDGGIAAVGGISLEFSQVIEAGHTTIAATGTGPPPPTGYQVLGFAGQKHYWDIDTSAHYLGSIQVCIHYDQAWVSGNELLLRLVHDGGTGFLNITTSLNTTTNVVCGMTNSLSPFAIVEPDTAINTPPQVSVPTDMVLEATRSTGAIATFVATATDVEDGDLVPSCTSAPGSLFPPGNTPVTCTAVDAAGASATATFNVAVRFQTPADGSFFLQPINPDGSSVFKQGSTVPVKFKLQGASAGITNLIAHLTVARVSSSVTGTYVEASSNGAADGGNTFRYDTAAKQYIFNLSTKAMSTGTWSLRADLGDRVEHTVNVSLR